jgi:hypothetical protein
VNFVKEKRKGVPVTKHRVMNAYRAKLREFCTPYGLQPRNVARRLQAERSRVQNLMSMDLLVDPSSHTTALESIQSLREMTTKDIPGR